MCQRSNSEASDFDREEESQPVPSKKRAKKSITRVNFQTSDKDLVVHRCGAYSFSCTVCSRRVSCQYQGVRDEKEHISSKIHQTLAKEALSQPKLSFPSVDPLTLKVRGNN